MPLTFLTADRALDEVDDEVMLPYGDPDRWRRPYRPGPWRVGAAALALLLASYLLLATMIVAFAGAPAGAAACASGAAAVIAAALRLLRTGVWVSPQGLRRVGFWTTTTLRWAEVSAVRTVQQPVNWLGLPRTVQGQALLAVRTAGEPLPVLLTDHSADFLGRTDAFDTAAEAVESWATDHRQ
ncbi:hypothetical protein ACFYYR_11965 [Streptomyces sp. NPDC001922]|uniref:hypothetical protein n=1 Tax=Streptomyces sp. NPDC001922 TaxID=3364624 RepID=UPI0036AF37FC